jgi:hypothetical protein
MYAQFTEKGDSSSLTLAKNIEDFAEKALTLN